MGTMTGRNGPPRSQPPPPGPLPRRGGQAETVEQMRNPLPRLAVFDCDGTLVDSQANIIAAMADAFPAAWAAGARSACLAARRRPQPRRGDAGDAARCRARAAAPPCRGLPPGVSPHARRAAAERRAAVSRCRSGTGRTRPARLAARRRHRPSPTAGWRCASITTASRRTSSRCRPPIATRRNRIRRCSTPRSAMRAAAPRRR